MRRIWFLSIAVIFLLMVGCDKPGEEEKEIPKDNTDWEIISSSANVMPPLTSGDILNGGQFIAVGAGGGFVAITTDGGLTWSTNTIEAMSSEGYGVNAIAFSDEQVGLLGGKKSLYRTTDGGQTWTQVAQDIVGDASVQTIQYIGENTFYALCGIQLLISNDGGQTWTAQDIDPLTQLQIGANGMEFFDRNHGLLATTEFVALYTSDGGQTWHIEDLGVDSVFYDVAAVDTSLFYLCGQNGMVIFRTPVETTLAILDTVWIYDSTMVVDSLNDTTWQVDSTIGYDTLGFIEDTTIGIYQRAENGEDRTLYSIDVYGDYGVIVGAAEEDETVLLSTDGGATWDISQYPNVYGDLVMTKFTPEGDAVLLVGDDGVRGGGAIRIGNGTLTQWDAANYGTSITILDLVFVNSQDGIFVGKKCAIYTTSDGGNTLIQSVCPTTEDMGDITINSVDFTTATNGIAVGTDSTIITTSDGGRSWQILPGDNISVDRTIDHLNKIQMVNENVGYIAGSEGILLKTEDGGDNWTQIPMDVEVELTALCFISENEGWVAGGSGLILHTTDGGASWEQQQSGVYSSISGITFIDSKLGWACGNMAILRTTDGGVNWQFSEIEPNLFGQFRDIAFTDSQRGWIVGNFGYILHTVDGGETWYRQASGYTENNLYAIYILNEANVWVAGDNGMIMKLIP